MNSAARLKMYELWFDFLNLAHYVARSEVRITREVSREEIQKALEGSTAYYESWDDTDMPFDAWWKTHGSLFCILNIPNPDDVDPFSLDLDVSIPPPSADALLLFIPLNRPRAELRDEVDAIIGKQIEIAKTAGKTTSRFRMTDGKLPRPGILGLKLTVYRDVALRYPTVRGARLMEKVHDHYKSRVETIPAAFNDVTNESSQKKLDRYLNQAEQVMMNVAKGQFPGPNDRDIDE